MPNEPFFEIGSKVVGVDSFGGHGDVQPLEGQVVDHKESGFGLHYAEVRKADGSKEWVRTIYLRKQN